MFVKCSCEQCNGHIEFDEGYAGLPIVCPHCGSETKLFIPSSPLPPPKIKSEASQNDTRAELSPTFSPAQTDNAPTEKPPVSPPQAQPALSPERIAYLTSIGVPDADKLDNPNHPWRHQLASPKQVAYLTYMGVPNAAQLTKKEAADLIDANPFLEGANSLAAIERIQTRQSRWHEERLKLYPELYAYELKEFLHEDLPNSLHGYVRRRMVGASELLTKAKIRRVVETLTSEDARWWHRSNHPEIFFERLRQMYPGCCDGRTTDQL